MIEIIFEYSINFTVLKPARQAQMIEIIFEYSINFTVLKPARQAQMDSILQCKTCLEFISRPEDIFVHSCTHLECKTCLETRTDNARTCRPCLGWDPDYSYVNEILTEINYAIDSASRQAAVLRGARDAAQEITESDIVYESRRNYFDKAYMQLYFLIWYLAALPVGIYRLTDQLAGRDCPVKYTELETTEYVLDYHSHVAYLKYLIKLFEHHSLDSLYVSWEMPTYSATAATMLKPIIPSFI